MFGSFLPEGLAPNVSFAALPHLRAIFVRNHKHHANRDREGFLSDMECTLISTAPALEELVYLCDDLSDAGLTALASMRPLQYMKLGDCSRVSAAGFAQLLNLTGLRHISLDLGRDIEHPQDLEAAHARVKTFAENCLADCVTLRNSAVHESLIVHLLALRNLRVVRLAGVLFQQVDELFRKTSLTVLNNACVLENRPWFDCRLLRGDDAVLCLDYNRQNRDDGPYCEGARLFRWPETLSLKRTPY